MGKIKDSDVYFKAENLNGDTVIGFFTKKNLNGAFVPVLERIRECDNGDYIESIEIRGETLEMYDGIL
jgi:hypothetical protein